MRPTPLFLRKVITITAEDSPNVRMALDQQAAGQEPTGEVVVQGVLTWDEYKQRRRLWDRIRQCVGLDAKFYVGAEVLLYPPEMLAAAQLRARHLRGQQGRVSKRQAKSIGVDSGQGQANTSWAVTDEMGLITLRSRKTVNTATITGDTIAMGKEFSVPANKWFFDIGGGGREHVDRLRTQGHDAQTVAFGAAVSLEPKAGKRLVKDRKESREDQYTYLNRRAQMYHKLMLLLSGEDGTGAFAIEFDENEATRELKRQMGLIPKVLGNWSMYDQEGRIRMLSKNKRTPDSKEITLTKIIGHSPDELDALVLAVYGTFTKTGARATAGAAF